MFLDNLQLIQPSSSFTILIRHAERQEFKIRQVGNNVPITASGAEAAIKFGNNPYIKAIKGIKSSPILRCLQTSNKILEGADLSNLKITTSTSLGDPGSYVNDSLIAGKQFLLNDTISVLKEYMDKGILDGFLSVKEGSVNLLSSILQDIAGKDSRCLYVSHDAVIVPFINYFTGEKFDREHWLGFLDGVIITELNGEISMIRNEKEYIINI
jgi:broad specificity phosphatase PhoE